MPKTPRGAASEEIEYYQWYICYSLCSRRRSHRFPRVLRCAPESGGRGLSNFIQAMLRLLRLTVLLRFLPRADHLERDLLWTQVLTNQSA